MRWDQWTGRFEMRGKAYLVVVVSDPEPITVDFSLGE
jgi:hypothetical protein